MYHQPGGKEGGRGERVAKKMHAAEGTEIRSPPSHPPPTGWTPLLSEHVIEVATTLGSTLRGYNDVNI